MDDMIRGMVSQKGDKWDNSFSKDITNHLFESSKGTGGLDLVALNIQRGRDHGLPGYNAYREICQIGRARNFDDLLDYMTPGKYIFLSIKKMQSFRFSLRLDPGFGIC